MIKIEKCTQLIEQNSVLLQKFNDQWKLVVCVTAFCYAWSDIVFFIRLSVGWTLANNRFTFVYDWKFLKSVWNWFRILQQSKNWQQLSNITDRCFLTSLNS